MRKATGGDTGKRTDEDKIFRTPIKVILGGTEYQIPLLVARDSKPWRDKAGPFRAELIALSGVDTNDAEAFKEAFTQLMGSRIDQTLDLFFEYAKDLNRDEIMAIATDQELVNAFGEVAAAAFPFGQ